MLSAPTEYGIYRLHLTSMTKKDRVEKKRQNTQVSWIHFNIKVWLEEALLRATCPITTQQMVTNALYQELHLVSYPHCRYSEVEKQDWEALQLGSCSSALLKPTGSMLNWRASTGNHPRQGFLGSRIKQALVKGHRQKESMETTSSYALPNSTVTVVLYELLAGLISIMASSSFALRCLWRNYISWKLQHSSVLFFSALQAPSKGPQQYAKQPRSAQAAGLHHFKSLLPETFYQHKG